jgi:hypothetical protein
MRDDLSLSFITAMISESNEPRTVAIFKFQVAGDIYVSDLSITIGGITYDPIVADWGSIEDAGDPETENSDILQGTITILNDGDSPFSDYFLAEDPENVEVEIYQWFVGLPENDLTLIGRFVMQDPIEFNENDNLLKIDIVSLNLRYDGPVGPILDQESFPNASTADLGKGIDLIVGTPGPVKTLAAKVGSSTTLNGPISSSSTNITVNDDISSWPASGTIQIGEEHIYYNSRTSSAFTARYRGFNSTLAADAEDGASVLERTSHTYLVGQGPLASISNVKVAGYPPPSSIYSVIHEGNPAAIFFTEPPYSIQFSRSTNDELIFFDDETSNNTAKFPHYAFDGKASTSAIINENNRTLAIIQLNPLRDIGQISKVFIRIEHFATDFYKNDSAGVILAGTGTVGTLSRPFTVDSSAGSVEINIDHDHEHKTGDQHTHAMDEPGYSADVENHKHALTGTADPLEVFPSGQGQLPIYQNEFDGFTDIIPNYSWTPLGDEIISAYIQMSIVLSGCDLEVREGTARRAYFNDDKLGAFTTQVVLTPPTISTIRFRVHGRGVIGGYVRITTATLNLTYAAGIEPNRSAVTPFLSESGSNDNTYNTNQPDDVFGLRVPNLNVPLELSSPTKILVDRIDITKYVTPYTWDYLQDKEIQIKYFGTNDNVDLLISELSIEVAYKKRVRVYSDDVTCEPVAAVGNRPNETINQLLVGRGGAPQNYIDFDSFETAKQRYVALGYSLNGVISANLTVKDAIKSVLRQCRSRLFWNAGLAKLRLKEYFVDWTNQKFIDAEDLQLKSISARRQRFSDIRNKITVLYDKNHTESGIDSYKSNVTKNLASSQSEHGIREVRDDWQFDLVRDASLATDLAEFYLSTLSTPSTFYDFNTYLTQFDLEKEDKIRVTSSGFNQMVRLPMDIKAVNRVFANSETGQINLINIVAESLRFIKRSENLSDSITIDDAINVLIGLLLDFSNQILISDDVAISESLALFESYLIEDFFDIQIDFIPAFSDSFTAADEIDFDISVELTDDVFIAEEPIFSKLFGYGTGGYGIEAGYGGVLEIGQRNSESVPIVDEIDFSVTLPLTDSVTIADEIAFGDGYGSQKLGDGYGLCPYGD